MLAMVAALSLVVRTAMGLESVAGSNCSRASRLGSGEMWAKSSPLLIILGSVDVLMHMMEAESLSPMEMMPLSTRLGSPWHSTASPGTRENFASGGKRILVATCLDEHAGIVMELAQERTGNESVSMEARSIWGVRLVRENMWPPLKDMELVVKSAFACVALRKSVPRMHWEDKSGIINVGKVVVLPSGVMNCREFLLEAARVVPAAEVMVRLGFGSSGAAIRPFLWIACSTVGWMQVILAPLSTRQETGILLIVHRTWGRFEGGESMAASDWSELQAAGELNSENSGVGCAS